MPIPVTYDDVINDRYFVCLQRIVKIESHNNQTQNRIKHNTV